LRYLVSLGQEMVMINMLDAKTRLSSLVRAIESGEESEIVIARNGRPAARLVPLSTKPKGQRIGVAKGEFEAPEDFDATNDEIAKLFGISAK
jgi:prevent-host-death family protein